jgi:hypothetical protein
LVASASTRRGDPAVEQFHHSKRLMLAFAGGQSACGIVGRDDLVRIGEHRMGILAARGDHLAQDLAHTRPLEPHVHLRAGSEASCAIRLGNTSIQAVNIKPRVSRNNLIGFLSGWEFNQTIKPGGGRHRQFEMQPPIRGRNPGTQVPERPVQVFGVFQSIDPPRHAVPCQ